MPTAPLIALGVAAWLGLDLLLGVVVGRAFRLGSDTDAELQRELAKGGEDWC